MDDAFVVRLAKGLGARAATAPPEGLPLLPSAPLAPPVEEEEGGGIIDRGFGTDQERETGAACACCGCCTGGGGC